MTALHLQAHPFYDAAGLTPVAVPMPKGLTVAQMLDRILPEAERVDSADLVVTVRRGTHSHELPAELWARVRPREGSEILVTRMPAGSGTLRSVAMLAVSAFAIWVTGGAAAGLLGSAFGAGTFGAAMLGMATSMVGMALVNSLIPPPTPDGGGSLGSKQQWNQLTGTSNQINPGGPIPAPLGEVRYFPPHAAMPYSLPVGAESFQYLMFDLGHDVDADDVSDMRIGDTPLSSYEGVKYEITKNPTLYRNDVAETVVNAALDPEGTTVVRTAAPGADEVAIDIVFPGGLEYINSSGSKQSYWALFRFEYRPVSGGAWLPLPAPRYTKHFQQWGSNVKVEGRYIVPFAVGVAFDVPDGVDVEVRVQRIDNDDRSDVNTYIDTASYTVLRSIKHTNPSTTGTTKLAMRIKANDQLTGTLQTLSLLLRKKVPVYNEATGKWTRQRTANTAWVVLDLMRTHSAVAKHVPDSRIALNTWLDYADFCEANDLKTRAVVDTRLTMGELLREVMAGSLGRLSEVQGKYAAMYDAGDKVARDALTTLESGNLRWSRAFIRRPHALRVRFKNPDANWQEDEIIVLDDGYSYRGRDARGSPSSAPQPTLFETLDLRMTADAKQAWKLGRLQLGQARYQSATATFETDIAGMRYYRGDVIRLENDVMEWGAGAGWVVGVNGTAVVLDGEVETDPLKTYKAQVRRIDANGQQVLDVYDVTPHSPVTATFYLPAGHSAKKGDTLILSAVGQEAPELILTHRATGNDKQFSFQAVPYDRRVAEFWANPPAAIVSEVTGKRYTEAPDPPVVIGVAPADRRDDAGIVSPGISVGFRQKSDYMRPNEYLVQLR